MKNLLITLGTSAICVALSYSNIAEASDYPVSVNDRPLTLPGGAWQSSASFLTGGDFERMGFNLGADYAVNNELQIGIAGIGAALAPDFAFGKSLEVGAAYSVHANGPLSIAATLGVPLSFEEGADALSSIGLGAMTRYNLMNGNLSIHTGENLLGIDFAGDLALALNIPVGIAYQINENINVRLDTMLAMIPLTDGDVVSIADVTPLNLMLAYSMDNKMDIGLTVGGDAQNFGDTLNLGVGIQYRGL